jgi:type I restriction-modification system DNA methylase subunit
MPTGFDEAFSRVKELVADFRANEKFYLSPAYREQEARRDFIDKFWLALGWDVNHETQKNPFEQEVKVERKEHGFSQRRADYAFYLAPNFRDVKFYVEAKKPHGDIATADNYFQTIRYGWSGKTKIAVLHDFEQLEIVDCRFEPKIKTVLSQNIRKFHFHDYEDEGKFAEIYWLFSREAVTNGSLEKFVATLPKKRSKDVQPGDIDERFLKDLDEFRDELARAFKNANPNLDGETLTELTQRTLDRLVFLRFLEDKHIEPQNHIAYFGDKGTAWQDFIAESRRLDGIYNGIVYKKHEILDATGFKLDDETFSGVCERLSHLNSPYDFNAIPIHILGSIYERFLGKVIVTTDKRARLEEKPEVRKAGGVYYTPEYIVRYIVENTVGKLIAGKSPGQIAEMRFADIACGSGSFLLGVYDLLIRHHTKFYNENPGKAKKGDVMERDDGLHLSLQKKREILLANIYGVDIDPQAVEVAQLSLYLKLLQDETPGSARNYQLEFHETLLPTLNKNIVCGNSLIGTDILTGQLFASDEEKKLNPMDFEQRFPHIFSRGRGNESGSLRETATPLDFTFPGVPLHGAFSYKKKKSAKVAPRTVPEFEGGFDAIVGNPPYIRIQRISARESRYLFQHYQWPTSKMDLSLVFLERGLRLTQRRGLVGFICTSQWLAADYGKKIRGELANGYLHQIVDFGSLPVFQNASTYPAILILSPTPAAELSAKKITSRESLNSEGIAAAPSLAVPLSSLSVRPWTIGSFDISTAAQTRGAVCRPLSEFGKAYIGTKCGMNEAFVLTRSEAKRLGIEKEILFPYAYRGAEVERYEVVEPDSVIIYPYRPDDDGDAKLISEPELKTKFPKAHAHLLSFKDALRQRQDSRRFYAKGLDWYRHLRAGSFNYIRPVKLALKGIAKECSVGLLQQKAAFDGARCPCVILENLQGCSPSYFLGLLNSKLATFQLKAVCPPKLNNYIEFSARAITAFPVRTIDFSNSADKARHDQMVVLVAQMLAAKKQLAGAQSDKDKDFYTNRCDGLDRQIDALVYDLYALTPAEIKIVEGAAK